LQKWPKAAGRIEIAHGELAEDPAVGKLVIKNNGIAIVVRFAIPAEPLPQ